MIKARCIAKLNLRNQVICADSVLAILLYEQQLEALYVDSMTPIPFEHKDITHIGEALNISKLLDVRL